MTSSDRARPSDASEAQRSQETGNANATVQAAHETVAVIADRAQYLNAIEMIDHGQGPIAIDAERASGYRYSARAYLIQIYRRGSGTFLFDPPAVGDFSELNEMIASEEWILHAAAQDLTCLREVGLHPTRIFDTELAARLAGMNRVGLGTVVEELLGIRLAKEHSAADWSTRPLPQSWLVYAALDVELLVDIQEKLAELLELGGKTDIAAQEFDDVLSRELVIVRAEPWRRLGGLHTVRGARNLAIARELWLARDAYARETDTAPGRLMPDSALIAAACTVPASKSDLAALKEFTGRASRSQIDRWWNAIVSGLNTEDLPALRMRGENIPLPRVWADKNPEADSRLRAARTALAEVAADLNLPLENLLTPDFLRRLAWTPPAEVSPATINDALAKLGARPWQRQATAAAIAAAFVEAAQNTVEAARNTEPGPDQAS